ncbi:MAG TPA: xanthine dehydrogenase family protein molybdopterin-binding subunit [Vicinamibacterales bacterium]|nr:xanthine dehydrogenase family protein molybdopterin-binding subunit [Vicinamibacterales bacterium]
MAPRVRGAVGRNVTRKEGADKVTGAARYIDDLTFPGLLHARTIRSTIPCGEILGVECAFDRTGFTIVDHRDIPGRNVVALIDDDQPCLAERTVRHVAEPILLLAHEDREQLRAASVRIDYAAATPEFDPDRAARVFKAIAIDKGSIDSAWAQADVIVEGEYRTGHQEQLYIETNGMIAVPEPDGGITVYGSMQCPYYVHRALTVLLDLPGAQVRVVQAETGGGFGGKEEYPSMLACHAAILARKANRPVKMIYDRVEDLLATTKRHPSIVRHRTGLTRDGRITAMDIDVIMDGGAYATLSAVVLSRGVIHASGPYRCDHVRIRGRAMMTHTPPNGAFRGFGAPQTQFAIEAHMDRVAGELGLDPVRLREINALRPGDTTATGQKLGKDTSALPVLRDAVKRSKFAEKRRKWQGTNRGIGLSLFFHGSGFTGGGEVKLASKASLELTATGAKILVASTEIGQGTRTMHAQIVADALGVPYDAIEVNEADTAFVPDSGPTVASRTCMIVGKLLERCARDMRTRLGRLTPAQYFRKYGSFTVTSEYEPPPGLLWDDNTYAGDAYGSYAWGCNVVELEVDPVTFEVTPLNVTAVAEIGKAIHPMMAIGQIEGGTAQGIGYALTEEVVMKDGRMANAQLTNYIIPTPMDAAPMDIGIMERPYRHGPFGAKGVGEMPIDGPAPAVVNALRHCGFDIRAIPATPEKLLSAFAGRNSSPASARRAAKSPEQRRPGL